MVYHLYFGMAPDLWRKANESASPEREQPVFDNRIALCGIALRQELGFWYRHPPDLDTMHVCPDCAAENTGLVLAGNMPVVCPSCRGTGLRAPELPPSVVSSCEVCMSKKWFAMRDLQWPGGPP